jgi:gliding motility-associated-like protein
MRTILSLMFALNGICLFAQEEKYRLPAFDQIIQVEWADLNNDSLLDVVVGYRTASMFKVAALQNNTLTDWTTHDILTTSFTDQIGFQIMDFNKDNKLDLVVSPEANQTIKHYYNQGNFSFMPATAWSPGATLLQFQYVDLNNDARWDTVWTDGITLHLQNRKDTTLSMLESFLIHDMDNNGYRDVLFSGVDTNNTPITFCWYLGNNFRVIARTRVAHTVGQLAVGTLNTDGLFDLIIAGKNASGLRETVSYHNLGKSFIASAMPLLANPDSTRLLLADFDSDGLTDVHQRGKLDNNSTINQIVSATGNFTMLGTNVLGQAFGDYDRDGDLDWSQINNDSIYIFANPASINNGPSTPFGALAIAIFNRIFFYWQKSADDHSNQSTLTYDLKVYDGNNHVVTADFIANDYHRNKVSHGNMGTNNFSLLRIPDKGVFEIQSVDNAFMTQVKSVCRGGMPGNGGNGCPIDVAFESILACGPALVKLKSPEPQVMWFSFNDGYLGTFDSLQVNAQTDTVFSFNPNAPHVCASIKVFTINHSPAQIITKANTQVNCQDRNVTLTVAPEWEAVRWTNNKNANSVTAQSINHVLTELIVFTAIATNEYGCTLNETFDLIISKPNLQLNGTHFQIMKGGEVQLVASGGESYTWSPTTSLSGSTIGNPVASPEITTTYSVTALDTLGCPAVANVLVEVSEEAFIPTLFTPNADSRNDNIKIYGLTQVNDFNFAIYNREGSVLYETTSVTEATQQGWNGKVNGTAQPPGTYYWKVSGKAPAGELLLNGKKAGAFLLVR